MSDTREEMPQGVDTFNGRSGNVVLTSSDIENAGGALTQDAAGKQPGLAALDAHLVMHGVSGGLVEALATLFFRSGMPPFNPDIFSGGPP